MQPVLPTSLDRTSAQVLGFDATAYIYDTPSTLHERLGIPANFNSGDYLAGNLAKQNNKKKNNILAVIAGVLGAAGLGALGFLGYKGKIKLPKLELGDKLSKITKPISKAFETAKTVVPQKFGAAMKFVSSKFDTVKKFFTKH